MRQGLALGLAVLASCATPSPAVREPVPAQASEVQSPGEPERTQPPQQSESELFVSQLSDELLVGQLQWIALRPPVFPQSPKILTESVRTLVSQVQPGGIVIFSDNLQNPAQWAQFQQNLRSLVRVPLLFAIDEEGGRVSRLASAAGMGVARRPAPRQWAAWPDDRFTAEARRFAQDIKAAGFQVNFAPLGDLALHLSGPIGDRSFGSQPDFVESRLALWIDAFWSEGLFSVVKHFPGLGSTNVDTHFGPENLVLSLSEWSGQEGRVFQSALGKPGTGVMLSHVEWPAFESPGRPVLFSEKIIQGLLRETWNYQGLVITDALDMGAIIKNYSPELAAYRALESGVDVLLMSPEPLRVHRSLLASLQSGILNRQILEKAVARQYEVKRRLLSWAD